MFSKFESELFGWAMPVVFACLYAIFAPRRPPLAPGLAYAPAPSAWWRILTLGGWRGALPVRVEFSRCVFVFRFQAFATVVRGRGDLCRLGRRSLCVVARLAARHVDRNRQVGANRPKNVCFSTSVGRSELPRWKKTLLLASIVAFVRSGKGRENKGMQQWLRSWELGHFP